MKESIGPGLLLIEIPPEINTIKTASGLQLYIDVSFEKERYNHVSATVIGVCEQLSCESMRQDRDKARTISEDKDIRIKVGDKVFFSYLAIQNSKKSFDAGHYFEEDGKRFAFMPYSSIFFVERDSIEPNIRHGDAVMWKEREHRCVHTWVPMGDTTRIIEFICVNNWLLIEPVNRQTRTEDIKGYGKAIIDEEQSTSKIAMLSNNPFKSSEGIVAACPPNCGLEVGETVIFQRESDIPVEYELVRTLNKPYWRMRLKDVVAKRVGRGVEIMRDFTLIIQDPAIKQGDFDFENEKPLTGTIVKIGRDVKGVKVGDHVFFNPGAFTEFPHGNHMGLLIPEKEIHIRTNGSKILLP